MTTCPRCGRVADELVCADCGMSLALARSTAAAADTATEAGAAGGAEAAAEPASGLLDDLAATVDDTPAVAAGEVRMWRLASLVGVTCLLAIATAIVLLQSGGGSHGSDGAQGRRAVPASATTRSTPSTPPRSATSTQQPVAPRRTGSQTTPSSSEPHPTKQPVEVRARSTTPSTGAPTTTAPTSSSTAPSPNPSVHVARGGLDPNCGPHCYRLVVTLSDFGAGTHDVACLSQHHGALGGYHTASATSAGCSFRQPHDAVWVVVDGRYRSNSVTL